MPVWGVMVLLPLPKNEDKRFLLPPKIFVSLSCGSEILPSLGVGGILLNSDMVVDGIVKK
jgi:hypothetical protein